MNIAEQKLLLEWARLQLQIAQSKNPTAKLDMSPENITRSEGYGKLRAFYVRLSKPKQARMRQMLRDQIAGVRDVLKAAASTGEDLSLADIDFVITDAETGEEVPPAPTIEQEQEE